MDGFHACIAVQNLYAGRLKRLEEVRTPGTGVTDSYKVLGNSLSSSARVPSTFSH